MQDQSTFVKEQKQIMERTLLYKRKSHAPFRGGDQIRSVYEEVGFLEAL